MSKESLEFCSWHPVIRHGYSNEEKWEEIDVGLINEPNYSIMSSFWLDKSSFKIGLSCK